MIDKTVVNPPCPTCERPGRHAKGDRFVCTACVTTWVARGWSTAIMKDQLKELMHELNIGSITTFVGELKNCAECGTEFPKNTFGNYTGHRVSFATYRVGYYCKNCVSNLKITPLRQFEKGDYVRTPDNQIARIVVFPLTSFSPMLQLKGDSCLISGYTTWALKEVSNDEFPQLTPNNMLQSKSPITDKMIKWPLVSSWGKLSNYNYVIDRMNHTIIFTDNNCPIPPFYYPFSFMFTREQVEVIVNVVLLGKTLKGNLLGRTGIKHSHDFSYQFDSYLNNIQIYSSRWEKILLPEVIFTLEEVNELAVMFGLKEAESE